MRNALLLLLILAPAGCSSASPATEPEPAAEPSRLATAFDATRTGRVSGRVTWAGEIPKPPPFLYCVPRPDGVGVMYQSAENPNRPRVDERSRAVAGAVVFLRGVDPARSRPWDLPSVSVEMGKGAITAIQGERRGRVGFVRSGQSFSATSTEAVYHVLRGRGDAYFSLALPEPHRAATRVLPTGEHVELSSGTGLYWARADLFVCEHPYFAVTDGEGRFVLDQVPAGKLEVVAWLPGWEVARQERNPDTTAISSMTYSAAIEQARAVVVEAGRAAQVGFSVP